MYFFISFCPSSWGWQYRSSLIGEETEVEELNNLPRAQWWEWDLYPYVYDSKAAVGFQKPLLPSWYGILRLIWFPVTDLPTMVSIPVRHSAPAKQMLTLSWPRPVVHTFKPGCQEWGSFQITCLHTMSLTGPLNRVPGFHSSRAMARHLYLVPPTPNPQGWPSPAQVPGLWPHHLSSLLPKTAIYWVSSLNHTQCQVLRLQQ